MASDTASRQHFSVDEKCNAVRRILGGESANRVAAELHVSLERLKRWERHFLTGGRAGIATHRRGSWRSGLGWRKVLPWVGLLIVLVISVYAASRFLQTPEP
jgi:transposase-like protein